MSQRHSLPFQMPGKTGRKTGLTIYGTPKRGANGIEDLNNFYLSDDDINDNPKENITLPEPTSPMRRLSIHSNKHQRLKELDTLISEDKHEDLEPELQLPRNELEVEDEIESISSAVEDVEEGEEEESEAEQSRIDDEIKSAETLGEPIIIDKEQLKNLNLSSKLTKNIALNNKSKNRSFNSQLIVNEKPLNRLSLITERRKSHVTERQDEKEQSEQSDVEQIISSDDAENGKGQSEQSDVEQIISSGDAEIENEEVQVTSLNKESSSEEDEMVNAISEESIALESPQSESVPDDQIEKISEQELIVEIEESPEVHEVDPIKEVDQVDADDEIEINDLDDGENEEKEIQDEELQQHTFTKTVLTPSRLRRSTKSPVKTPKKSPIKKTSVSKTPIKVSEPLKNPMITNKPVVKPLRKNTTTSTITNEPIRRSTRHRIPPVASWKNEKVVYKTEKVNGVYVKTVKDIAPAIESPEPIIRSQSLKKPSNATNKNIIKPKTTKKTPINKKRRNQPEPEQENELQPITKKSKNSRIIDPYEFETPNGEPESDWQKKSSISIPVFEGPGTGTQVERVVAWAPNSYKNSKVITNDQENFRINTLFDIDSEFCGAGIIEIGSGDKKAVKSNNDTYFIFHVINGSLNVSINNTTFTVTNGCTFEIPMGNYYQFINTGNDTAKLLFVQAKYVVIGESDDDDESGESDDEDDDNNSD